MIECEKWFHADDIIECEDCGVEFCEECLQNYHSICKFDGLDFNQEDDFDDENQYPSECPHCGEKLELDHNYEGEDIVSTLYCPNSDCEEDFEMEFARTDEKEVDEYSEEDDE